MFKLILNMINKRAVQISSAESLWRRYKACRDELGGHLLLKVWRVIGHIGQNEAVCVFGAHLCAAASR